MSVHFTRRCAILTLGFTAAFCALEAWANPVITIGDVAPTPTQSEDQAAASRPGARPPETQSTARPKPEFVDSRAGAAGLVPGAILAAGAANAQVPAVDMFAHDVDWVLKQFRPPVHASAGTGSWPRGGGMDLGLGTDPWFGTARGLGSDAFSPGGSAQFGSMSSTLHHSYGDSDPFSQTRSYSSGGGPPLPAYSSESTAESFTTWERSASGSQGDITQLAAAVRDSLVHPVAIMLAFIVMFALIMGQFLAKRSLSG